MKRLTSSAFTLIEMLTVMAVIAILASLIVAVNAFAHRKAALSRANGEIQAMTTALENYKGDNGAYPREDSTTDVICPLLHGAPTDPLYQKSSLALYKALSGDAKQGTVAGPPSPTDQPDGKPETKTYFEFPPIMLKKDSAGNILSIQDPFGNPYAYSTIQSKVEADYLIRLQIKPDDARPASQGFSPNFDLWSTGGTITKGGDLNDARKRWVKNW